VTGFDQINMYAVPAAMLAGARRLAGVAAKLGPAGVRHRTIDLAPGAFAAVTHSEAAQHAWTRATGLLASYLGTTTPAIESLSERVYRSSQAYRSVDARVSQMYRELLLELDQGGAGAPAGPAPVTNDGIPPAGTHPDAVHDWWQRLGEDARATAIAEHPDRVGWLDGVPAEMRDQANRILLDREIAHQRQLAEEYRSGPPDLSLQLSGAEAKIAALDAVRTRLDGEPKAFLLGVSAEGDGLAVVAVGNPDTARQVLTYVPGMASDLTTVPAQVDRMDAIVARAPAHTAAVLWLGYDAPDLGPQVLLESYARDAAEPLNRFQDGLRATHLGDPSYNVLLAHSYGTTTYGITAAERGVSADSVYLIGSIGTNQQSANGFLGTSTPNVYVTTHGPDVAHVLPWVDYYGPDPSRAPFDAHHLPGDYDGLLDSHTSYLFRPEILDNITGLLTRR
jgi:hypothetical protein